MVKCHLSLARLELRDLLGVFRLSADAYSNRTEQIDIIIMS